MYCVEFSIDDEYKEHHSLTSKQRAMSETRGVGAIQTLLVATSAPSFQCNPQTIVFDVVVEVGCSHIHPYALYVRQQGLGRNGVYHHNIKPVGKRKLVEFPCDTCCL